MQETSGVRVYRKTLELLRRLRYEWRMSNLEVIHRLAKEAVDKLKKPSN